MEKEKSFMLGQINRIFEQSDEALSCYSDFAQVFFTGSEVVLQFYETIPGAPGHDGQIQMVRTRLRATISVSVPHAKNIGDLLIKQVSMSEEPQPQVPQTGETK